MKNKILILAAVLALVSCGGNAQRKTAAADTQKAAAAAAAPTKTEDAIRHFVDSLAVRTDSGNRISDATIRKIRQMAYEMGFLTVEDGG